MSYFESYWYFKKNKTSPENDTIYLSHFKEELELIKENYLYQIDFKNQDMGLFRILRNINIFI